MVKKIRVLNADGTVNLDKSIYNWINQGDRIDRGAPGENPARNSARYLYPALIHKDGKTVKYYVSIDDLGYTQKTGELFAIREAPLTRPETAEQLLHSRVAQQSTAVLNPDKLKPGQTLPPGSLDVLLRPPPNNKSSHLEAVGDCVACRMAQMPFSFVHLTNTLAPSMQSADRAFNQTTKENSRSVNATYTNFARTCGFKLDDFLPEIRRQASQVPIEPETLLAARLAPAAPPA